MLEFPPERLRERALAEWCHHLWNEHPRAKRHGVAPQDVRPVSASRDIAFLARLIDVWATLPPESYEQAVVIVCAEFEAPPPTESRGVTLLRRYLAVFHLLEAAGPEAVLVYAGLSEPEIEAWDLHSAGLSYQGVAAMMGRNKRTVQGLIERANYKLRTLLEFEDMVS